MTYPLKAQALILKHAALPNVLTLCHKVVFITKRSLDCRNISLAVSSEDSL